MNHQAGPPYMSIYGYGGSASINQDFYTSNDLIYVPTGADDVVITNGTWSQLEAYLQTTGQDKYAGEIAPRNSSHQPYVTQTDLSIRQQIPIPGRSSLQVAFDIFNFWNLIDGDSGWVRYVPFGTVTPVIYRGLDDATGNPIYELTRVVTEPEDNPIFSTDNLQSRWRMRLGVIWSF